MVLYGTSGTFWKFYKNYLLFLVHFVIFFRLFVIFLFVGTVPGWVDSNPKWGRACRPLSLQLQGHHCLQGQTTSEQLLPTTGRSLASTNMYFIQGGHHCHQLCQYQMVNLCTGPFGGGEHVHRDVKVRQNCLVAHQVSIFTRSLIRYQFLIVWWQKGHSGNRSDIRRTFMKSKNKVSSDLFPNTPITKMQSTYFPSLAQLAII